MLAVLVSIQDCRCHTAGKGRFALLNPWIVILSPCQHDFAPSTWQWHHSKHLAQGGLLNRPHLFRETAFNFLCIHQPKYTVELLNDL